MSFYTRDELYGLLPAMYRERDAEAGFPLRDFVEVLAREAQVVEKNIEDLYDGWFIETCAEWLVPYLGDLVGVEGLGEAAGQGVLRRRAEVANTLRLRQRKGTAAVLEQLARDVTGWPARAVEFFERLETTQQMNHVRPHSLRTPDLRDANRLELLETPFSSAARSFEARRVEPRRGCYNLPNIGLFLWRLAAYPLRFAEPRHLVEGEPRFTFDALGYDVPLFHLPVTEVQTSSLAGELNVPGPIRRRALHETFEAYYGKSFGLFEMAAGEPRLIEGAKVRACNLQDWSRPVAAGVFAVDPELGRIKAGAGAEPSGGLLVSYHHGFSADLGGGRYERSASFSKIRGAATVTVQGDDARTAFAQAMEEAMSRLRGGVEAAIVLIPDSRTYLVDLRPGPGIALEIPAGRHLEIRAAAGERPALHFPDHNLVLDGEEGSSFELNGVLLSGLPILARGELGHLTLRHSTLAPRARFGADGSPLPVLPVRLFVESGSTEVLIDHSLVGTLRVDPQARVKIFDSVVDARDADGLGYFAASSFDREGGGPLTVVRSTVIGQVHTRRLELAESSLFLGTVEAEQRQEGCVRFCHVPLGSRVPQRYRCQPEIPPGAGAAEAARLAARVFPRFTSLTYGDPGYCQLDWRGPREILRGGDDESEMGVFSSLQQGPREDSLRIRLDEYLRLGLEAGILFVT